MSDCRCKGVSAELREWKQPLKQDMKGLILFNWSLSGRACLQSCPPSGWELTMRGWQSQRDLGYDRTNHDLTFYLRILAGDTQRHEFKNWHQTSVLGNIHVARDKNSHPESISKIAFCMHTKAVPAAVKHNLPAIEFFTAPQILKVTRTLRALCLSSKPCRAQAWRNPGW